jgi:hypothetical protein
VFVVYVVLLIRLVILGMAVWIELRRDCSLRFFALPSHGTPVKGGSNGDGTRSRNASPVLGRVAVLNPYPSLERRTLMRYLKHPLLCGTCQCLVWLAGDAIPSIVEPWSGAARRLTNTVAAGIVSMND